MLAEVNNGGESSTREREREVVWERVREMGNMEIKEIKLYHSGGDVDNLTVRSVICVRSCRFVSAFLFSCLALFIKLCSVCFAWLLFNLFTVLKFDYVWRQSIQSFLKV